MPLSMIEFCCDQLSKYFSELGKKSVAARMKKVSAQRRQEIGQNAAKARWAKQRRKKKSKARKKS
jgi:methionyl-tRNA formyltransferase